MKICSLYGAGFYYIPGTDTCLKVGGYVRAEVNYNAGGSFSVPATLNLNNRNASVQNWRTRAAITLDARSQTEYGTLRSYLFISTTDTNSTGAAIGNGTGASGYNALYAPAAFIQFAGFTAGKTGSFFDFDGQSYSNQSNFWGSNQGGNGIELFAYTAQFGNGLSASISAENAAGRRLAIVDGPVSTTAYANQEWPDVVANLRIDQAWGSAQVMGALHQVRAQDSAAAQLAGVSDHPSDKVGWAIGAGLKLNAPMFGPKDYVIGQFTYGKGAMDYVASGAPLLQTVTSGYPVTSASVGPLADAVWNGGAGGTLDLTTGWSFTGGYEHFWNAQWKTSLYGAYGKVEYTDASSATLAGAVGTSANWDFWQVGSRTVWTPVANLDLSVDIMYNRMGTAFSNVAGSTSNDWVSGMFRVQRNFYP